MLVPLLLVLAQEPQQAAPSPVARVEVTPSSAEVQVGQAIQMEARAVGADGQPVELLSIIGPQGERMHVRARPKGSSPAS